MGYPVAYRKQASGLPEYRRPGYQPGGFRNPPQPAANDPYYPANDDRINPFRRSEDRRPFGQMTAERVARRLLTKMGGRLLRRAIPVVGQIETAYDIYRLFETKTETVVTTGNPPDRAKAGWEFTPSYWGTEWYSIRPVSPNDYVHDPGMIAPSLDPYPGQHYGFNEPWPLSQLTESWNVVDPLQGPEVRYYQANSWTPGENARADPTEWLSVREYTETRTVSVPRVEARSPNPEIVPGFRYEVGPRRDREAEERVREDEQRRPHLTPPLVIQTPGTGGAYHPSPNGHQMRKPGSRTRERKFIANIAARSILGKMIGGVTESLDFINAIWEALPPANRTGQRMTKRGKRAGEYVQAFAPTPNDKLRDIYRGWDKIDVEAAIRNVILEQLEDALYGRLGRAQQRLARNTLERIGRPVGLTTGPSL